MKIAIAGPILTAACRRALGLQLEGAPLGTGQTPIVPLAASLRAMGHDVHILTTDPTVEETVTVEEDGFTLTFCPLRGPPKYRARVRAMDLFEKEIEALTAALKSLQPDIVHAHWTYEFAEAAVRSGLPHVVTMHDLGWQCLGIYRDPYRAMRLLMKYRVMSRVRALTVVAPFMAAKARAYGYFGPVDVVPNGVEVPPIEALARDRDLSRPRFVTIGNAERLKNVSASVAAFRFIREALPDAELHLFGPGLDTEYTKAEPGVVGHGPTSHPELMAFLEQKATVLIHPSRLETFGVIIAEAKVRQVPVVGGRDSGGVSFVCGDEGSCLVDVEDPKDIASGALSLLEAERHEEARVGARQDAMARFASRPAAESYLDVYVKVLSDVGR